MNKGVTRVMQCFFRNNFHSINRRVTCSLVTFRQEKQRDNKNEYKTYCGYAAGTALSFALGVSSLKSDKDYNDTNNEFGSPRSDLPYYKMKDVEEHSSKETGVWVTYRQGVYDITNFVDHHPGGDVILMAAGGSLDPFWNLYAIHKQTHVLKILEKFRIGNLDKDEAKHNESSDDPFAWEPKRHPALKPSSAKPFCAEPPAQLLVQNNLTPQELFFVRNHLPVPEVDPETYELEITGDGLKTVTYTLEDLKKMPQHTVTAAVMCAGNRRSEMAQIKPIKGLNWAHAAIGNAEWTGTKLSDLLSNLEVYKNSGALHVQFEGLDTDVKNSPYGASIPLVTALDPRREVILAYEMNGEPLSRDHGFPLRVIVPGTAGARNVKWLSRIIISECESDSHWQQCDYKGFNPSVDWDTVDYSKAPAIQDLPVISAICVPIQGDTVSLNSDGTVSVKGYAWSGGGRGIIRVDLTCDDGCTWHTADLNVEKQTKPGHYVWNWSLWEANIPLPKDVGDEVEICVKAVDSSYNTQPESFQNIWNLRGVLNNAYHRVKVKISK